MRLDDWQKILIAEAAEQGRIPEAAEGFEQVGPLYIVK